MANKPDCYGIIPARYDSTRFPGKPLADIMGKPMFWHVYSRAKKCIDIKEVYLATDDQRIADSAEKLAVPVVLTRSDHPSGTDRVFEAARKLNINASDLKIDVFRSSGHGGQSVNTTDSAVRITHLPSGLVVTCQDERSQLKNKNKALRVLRARLMDQQQHQETKKQAEDRKSQVKTGERSEKIRTYNFPAHRVTDHRVNLTLHKLEAIMEGNLDEITQALIKKEQEANISG